MRHLQECSLVISAASKEQWPESDLPEIVLSGRSNVGKSSFINAMTNRKKLAYIGNTPGKTRLLNFFNLDNQLMFVDVPGYGYANISQAQLIKFGEMMEDYFSGRENKRGLVMLVDARHRPSEDDLIMIEYARYYSIPVMVVATKIDKIKNSQRHKNLMAIQEDLKLGENSIISFSAETKEGLDEAWKAIDDMIEKR